MDTMGYRIHISKVKQIRCPQKDNPTPTQEKNDLLLSMQVPKKHPKQHLKLRRLLGLVILFGRGTFKQVPKLGQGVLHDSG